MLHNFPLYWLNLIILRQTDVERSLTKLDFFEHCMMTRRSTILRLKAVLKDNSLVECSEKYKSFKLKIPQPDSERRHNPFRTVFGIMIGPFSFCEIGKTWGTNKKVNKQTNKNWNFQFPQPDYQPRHSPDFRTVFGIMIGPFSSCKIGKTWGT